MERLREVIDGGRSGWCEAIPCRSDDLSELKRRDARGHIFQADLLNIASTVWPKTTKLGRITHMGRSLFLVGHPHPYRKGGGVPTLPTLVFISICAYNLWRRTTKFDLVMGRGVFILGRQPRSTWRRRDSSAPQFWVLSIVYTLCRTIAKFDVVTRVGRVTPFPESRVLGIPNFGGSRVFMRTTFKAVLNVFFFFASFKLPLFNEYEMVFIIA